MERTIRVLNDMKRDLVIEEYAVGGAIAALFYVEPFETHDLDVFLILKPTEGPLVSLESVFRYLTGRGYSAQAQDVLIEGVPVQFLVAGTSLVDEAIHDASNLKYGDEPVRVMTPEHLLAMMVELGRPKDRARVALFLEECEFDRPRLSEILDRHQLKDRWSRILKEIGVEDHRS
jgi:hypothetical protein